MRVRVSVRFVLRASFFQTCLRVRKCGVVGVCVRVYLLHWGDLKFIVASSAWA